MSIYAACLTGWNTICEIWDEVDNAVEIGPGIWIFKADLILIWRLKHLKKLKCDSCVFKESDTEFAYCWKDHWFGINPNEKIVKDPWINCKDFKQII